LPIAIMAIFGLWVFLSSLSPLPPDEPRR